METKAGLSLGGGHTAAVSDLLSAVDVIWPFPPDPPGPPPKTWALNRMAKFLIIRAAWKARYATKGSGGGGGLPPNSSPPAAEPKTIKVGTKI